MKGTSKIKSGKSPQGLVVVTALNKSFFEKWQKSLWYRF